MRGIRPSGFSRRFARTYRSPTILAPASAEGFLAMTVRFPAGRRPGLTLLLAVRGRAVSGDRLLQAVDLLLKRRELRLRVRGRRGRCGGGRRLYRCRGCDRSLNGGRLRRLVVLVHAL